jgi:hypothetical protein
MECPEGSAFVVGVVFGMVRYVVVGSMSYFYERRGGSSADRWCRACAGRSASLPSDMSSSAYL